MAVAGCSPAPTLRLERTLVGRGFQFIAGVDEVGRGSLAGPVVAAAVILPVGRSGLGRTLLGVRDSKQLSPEQRGRLFETVLSCATAVSLGWVSHHGIDHTGIGPANRQAMERAVARLSVGPQALIVDHLRLPNVDLPQVSLPRADSISLSVAAASIVAKVIRDRWMDRCESRYPGYGFGQHKGYGTAFHREALRQLGPCAIHRRTFAPVAACLP